MATYRYPDGTTDEISDRDAFEVIAARLGHIQEDLRFVIDLFAQISGMSVTEGVPREQGAAPESERAFITKEWVCDFFSENGYLDATRRSSRVWGRMSAAYSGSPFPLVCNRCVDNSGFESEKHRHDDRNSFIHADDIIDSADRFKPGLVRLLGPVVYHDFLLVLEEIQRRYG